MPERPPPRRRRAEVLEAAGELFLENGYEATSTADIARRLGILRGSIYYYLDSKEGLLFELIEDAHEGFVRAIDAIAGSDDDALTKLRHLIEQHIVFLTESRVATTLFLTESRSLTPEHRTIVARHEETYRRSVAALIRDGQGSGVIRADVDAELATMLFLGAANWIHRWYGPEGAASVGELARQFSLIIGDGLRAS
jgi:TetR/AcrR family transcriptional regulator, cholesterol catabolism regulator